MATILQPENVPPARLKENGIVNVQEIPLPAKPSLLIVHDDGEESIVRAFANVLGQQWASVESLEDVHAGVGSTICGLAKSMVGSQLHNWNRSRVLINAHCVDGEYHFDD